MLCRVSLCVGSRISFPIHACGNARKRLPRRRAVRIQKNLNDIQGMYLQPSKFEGCDRSDFVEGISAGPKADVTRNCLRAFRASFPPTASEIARRVPSTAAPILPSSHALGILTQKAQRMSSQQRNGKRNLLSRVFSNLRGASRSQETPPSLTRARSRALQEPRPPADELSTGAEGRLGAGHHHHFPSSPRVATIQAEGHSSHHHRNACASVYLC